MALELFVSYNDEPSRDLRLVRVSLADSSSPLDHVSYLAGSIENIQHDPTGRLLYMIVEDQTLRGRGLAGRMLRGFGKVLQEQGIIEFHSKMNTPEALGSIAKVFDDDDIGIYDSFEPRTRLPDGSPKILPMSVEQAQMTNTLMRERTPQEDWLRLRYLGSVVSLASIDTTNWQMPQLQDWSDR